MKVKLRILMVFICLALITTFIIVTYQKSESQEVEISTLQQTKKEKIQLKIYAQYSDEDTKFPYDYAVEQVKYEFPDVELVLDIQAQDDGQKLQTYAATGNLPDIFQVGLQQIESFKESGNIMALNEIAKETGFIEKMNPGTESILYHKDGNIYAFPYAGNEIVVWYYNTSIFQKYNLSPPKTFDELLHVIEVLRENDIIPMTCFGKEKWITSAMYDVIATRYDAGGIKKLDEGSMEELSEAYVEAARILERLVKAGMFPENITSLNYDQASELFYSGKAAMMLNGQWEIETVSKRLTNTVDWMYYPSYSIESYEAGKMAFSGGGAPGGYAVNSNSEHKELAARVAAFISEKYCEAKYLYRSNPFIAVQVIGQEKVTFPPMMQQLFNISGEVSTTKFTWGLSDAVFKTGIEDQSQLLLTKQYSADEFVEEINKVLKRVN